TSGSSGRLSQIDDDAATNRTLREMFYVTNASRRGHHAFGIRVQLVCVKVIRRSCTIASRRHAALRRILLRARESPQHQVDFVLVSAVHPETFTYSRTLRELSACSKYSSKAPIVTFTLQLHFLSSSTRPRRPA